MMKSTRKGSGAGMPEAIGRDELPPRRKGNQKPVKKVGEEAVAVIAQRIADQRRAAWQDLQDGKPEAWEALRLIPIQTSV